MAPFEIQGDERLSAVVNIRLTAEEKEEVRGAAIAAGLSVSEFGRRRLLGIKIVARTDQVIINELRRIGGLLKHVHLESSGAYSRQTSAALEQLKCYLEKISGDR